MANNISVSITADVADLTAKRAILSAELRAATADLNNFAKTAASSGMTSELRASMLASAEAVARLKTQVAGATAELKAMGAASTTGFAALKEGVSGAVASVTAFREMVTGIGQALIAAFAVREIADMANAMGQAAEQTQHAATTFGLTTEQVQRMRAEATGLGLSMEAFQTAMQRADGALTRAREGSKQSGEAFKLLGINIHEPIDNLTLLNETIAGLAQVQDVPTRVGLAMQIFGRNIQEIAPLIGVTKEQLAQLNTTIDHSGAVSEGAQAAGMKLAEAQNAQQVAIIGLKNALTEAFAPALTVITQQLTKLIEEFVQSYREGGLAKTVMDELAVALRVAASAALALLASILPLLGAWQAMIDLTEAEAEALVGNFDGAMKSAKKAADDFTASLRGAAEAMADLNSLMTGSPALKLEANARTLPQGEIHLPSGLGAAHKGRGSHEDKAYEAKIAKDELQLQADKDLHDKELADFDKYIADVAAKYGTDSKQYFDALKRKLEYTQSYAKEQARIEDEAAKRQLEAQTRRINEETQATIKGAQQQYSAIKAGLDEQIAAAKEAFQAGEISRQKEWAEISALEAQKTAALRAELTTEYQAKVDQADKLAALRKQDFLGDLDLAMQKLGLWTTYYSQLKKLDADALKQRLTDQTTELKQFQQEWSSFIDPMVSKFSNGLLQMAEGTRSFAQVFASIGQQILQSMVNVIDKMVERWILAEVTKLFHSQATNVAKVASDAAAATSGIALATAGAAAEKVIDASRAFSGGVASMAAAPWPLDMTAPAFGAEMAAIASAAGGFDVPAGVSPLTQLHPQEMVLPARLADGVRAITGATAGDLGAPSGGSSGDVHLHMNMGPGADGQSLQNWFNTHGPKLVQAIQKQTRRGAVLAPAT